MENKSNRCKLYDTHEWIKSKKIVFIVFLPSLMKMITEAARETEKTLVVSYEINNNEKLKSKKFGG